MTGENGEAVTTAEVMQALSLATGQWVWTFAVITDRRHGTRGLTKGTTVGRVVADTLPKLLRDVATFAEQATGQGSGSEIPVNTARQRLLDLLDRLGIDGAGWHSVREILTDERDRALARVEELETVALDLQRRLYGERERADAAEARLHDVAAVGSPPEPQCLSSGLRGGTA